MESFPNSEQEGRMKVGIELGEGVGIIGLNSFVLFNEADGSVEFLEDPINEVVYRSEAEIKRVIDPLVKAGVGVEFESASSDGESGSDWEGYIRVSSIDLNAALKEGRIKTDVSDGLYGKDIKFIFLGK